MNTTGPFSIRAFLRSRNALLVHFNTPMQTRHPTGFPDDLTKAKLLKGEPISFSTIKIDDLGPCNVALPGNANAGGSVGLVVDIEDTGSVETVDSMDSGTGNYRSGGKPPNAVTCAKSLDERTTSNEWYVRNYRPVGIFIFQPSMVFVRDQCGHGERDTDLNEILLCFPNDRIFTTSYGKFREFDRGTHQWKAITYDDIIT